MIFSYLGIGFNVCLVAADESNPAMQGEREPLSVRNEWKSGLKVQKALGSMAKTFTKERSWKWWLKHSFWVWSSFKNWPSNWYSSLLDWLHIWLRWSNWYLSLLDWFSTRHHLKWVTHVFFSLFDGWKTLLIRKFSLYFTFVLFIGLLICFTKYNCILKIQIIKLYSFIYLFILLIYVY